VAEETRKFSLSLSRAIIENPAFAFRNVKELTADFKNNPWKLLLKPKGR